VDTRLKLGLLLFGRVYVCLQGVLSESDGRICIYAAYCREVIMTLSILAGAYGLVRRTNLDHIVRLQIAT